MNYFELYPGDYRRDTGRLSLAEHGAYLLLMADYYASEKPLPADLGALCRIVGAQGKAEQQAVKAVAEQYFPVGDDGLRHNTRADREIAKAQKRISIARANGAKGGRKAEQKQEPADEPKTNPEETQRDTQPVTRRDTQQGTRSGEALHTPHATRQSPSDSSSLSGSFKASDTRRACVNPASPTAAGEACKAMRGAGLIQTNPAHPGLLALIDAGATPAQFAMAAGDAVSRGKGFAYALGILKGQLADAASAPKPSKGDPEAIHNRNRAIAAEWLAEQSAGGIP